MSNGYYHTKESVEEYIRLARDVNGAALIRKLKDFLPIDATLLELGTGPGTDWKILSEDYRVTGSDNSLEFLNHLRSNNPEGEFIELDASTLSTDDRFDAIYSNKVMHHLKDAELTASIQRQHEILKPEGLVCHSFWKGEGTEVFKGLFVNYHSEDSIKKLFGDLFEPLLLEGYAEFEEDDSLLLIAQRK